MSEQGGFVFIYFFCRKEANASAHSSRVAETGAAKVPLYRMMQAAGEMGVPFSKQYTAYLKKNSLFCKYERYCLHNLLPICDLSDAIVVNYHDSISYKKFWLEPRSKLMTG